MSQTNTFNSKDYEVNGLCIETDAPITINGTVYTPDADGIIYSNNLHVNSMSLLNGQAMTKFIIRKISHSITNTSRMFSSCENLHTVDLSNFDTSKVVDMSSMFYHCKVLSSLNLSNFDTSNVTNMTSMFEGCYALSSLDLSNFNTSKVINTSYMFYQCSYLTSLKYNDIGHNSNCTSEGFYKILDYDSIKFLADHAYDRATAGYTSAFTISFRVDSRAPQSVIDTFTSKGFTVLNLTAR